MSMMEKARPLATAFLSQKLMSPILKKEAKWRNILPGFVLPLGILLIWQLLSGLKIISPLLFPSPVSIAKEFYNMILSGELGTHLLISIQRAALGFLLGGSLGLFMGLFVGLKKRAEQFFDPSLQMLRTVPHLAITPLFILWFGFGEVSKVLLIALGAFFPLYVNTLFVSRGKSRLARAEMPGVFVPIAR